MRRSLSEESFAQCSCLDQHPLGLRTDPNSTSNLPSSRSSSEACQKEPLDLKQLYAVTKEQMKEQMNVMFMCWQQTQVCTEDTLESHGTVVLEPHCPSGQSLARSKEGKPHRSYPAEPPPVLPSLPKWKTTVYQTTMTITLFCCCYHVSIYNALS